MTSKPHWWDALRGATHWSPGQTAYVWACCNETNQIDTSSLPSNYVKPILVPLTREMADIMEGQPIAPLRARVIKELGSHPVSNVLAAEWLESQGCRLPEYVRVAIGIADSQQGSKGNIKQSRLKQAGGVDSLPELGGRAYPEPRANFGESVNGGNPERYTALGELLDLPLPERMQLIEREPTKLLGVRDEWMEIAKFEGYDEEVGSWGGCWSIKKKIDYRLLTETLVTWADAHLLADAAAKLNDYFLCVMAAYEPGDPWGDRRTDAEVKLAWQAAWAALERIVNRCKLEISRTKQTPMPRLSESACIRLTEKQRLVFDLLRTDKGMTGKSILNALQANGQTMDQSTLTKSIIPGLKDAGVRVMNKRGYGYYLET